MEVQVHQSRDPESFYRLCMERGQQGVTDDDLAKIGWTNKAEIMQAVNVLLKQGLLQLTQLAHGKFLYQAVSQEVAARLNGLDGQHRMILQLIEKAGDQGAWSKFLKDQSNLAPHTITRVTKELMRRQLIKEVKSVQGKNRKVFMAWDVEPSREVTGGTWYQDGEFAAGWIEQLRGRCRQFLDDNPRRAVTLQEVHTYVVQQPGPSVPTDDDVRAILRTLELDEEVYVLQTAAGQAVYTARPDNFDILAARLPDFVTKRNTLADQVRSNVAPCLQCHLIDQCRPGGNICPEKCEYITLWLTGGAADENSQDMNDW